MTVGIKVDIREMGGVHVVELEGRLDATSTPVLEKKLDKLLEVSKQMVIDFSKVDYLSSAGMRFLLSSTKKFKGKGGVLAFSGMNDEVMEIIKMAGFERILNLYPTQEDALKALG